MRKPEIEQAILDGTHLAWTSTGLSREGAWPSGGHKVMPLKVVGGGRVRVRHEESGGERVVASRDLMAEWTKYAEVRERAEERYRERREKRDALRSRAEAVVEALGGGASLGSGVVDREVQQGVWLPVELAEQVVAGLAALAPESAPARAVRALGSGEG